MKRLFLTGTSGFGKSTSIWKALGDHMYDAGGFLSVRHTNEAGEAMYFTLQRPDGSDAQIFLWQIALTVRSKTCLLNLTPDKCHTPRFVSVQ